MGSLMNRRTETVSTLGIKGMMIPFSYQLNGTSAPVNFQGLGCTVVRADTGLHTVTLPAGFPTTTFVYVGGMVKGTKGGGSNSGLAFEAFGSPESGTFGIRIMNGGTTTLVDPAASTTVYVNGLIFAAGAGTRSRNV